MKRTIDELFEIVDYQKAKEAGRNTKYELLDSIGDEGKFTTRMYEAMGTTQIPTTALHQLFVNWQRIKENDIVNLTTLLPDIKYDPPPRSGEAGPKFSQALTFATRDKWKYWEMHMTIDSIGFHAARYGVICLQLHPNFREKNITLTNLHPKRVYTERALHGHGRNIYTLDILTANGWQIAYSYPQARKLPDFVENATEYEIVTYYDDQDKYVFLNKQKMPDGKEFKGGILPKTGVTHDLGFNPILIVPIQHSTKSNYGYAARYYEAPLIEMLNDFLVLNHKNKRLAQGGLMMIKNGNQVPEEIPFGEPAQVEVGPDGDVKMVPYTQSTHPSDVELNQLQELLRIKSNLPPGRTGFTQSSISTGRSESALLAGVGDESDNIKKHIGYAISLADTRALEMDSKLFPNVVREVFIKWKGNTEAWEFKPKDIPTPGPHTLIWNPFGSNQAQQIVSYLQLQGQGDLDRRTIIERLPGFDVDEIMARLEEDEMFKLKLQQRAMEMQAQAEAAAQGGMQQPELNPEEVESATFALQQQMASAM